MSWPLLISVPHCGLDVPEEVAERCILSADQIVADGDVGAWELYAPLCDRVTRFEHASVARAIVDLNRAEDDFGKDGVIKTHTCWDEPVYSAPLPSALVDSLLERYYRPYHERLTEGASSALLAGVDCHTMAEVGPPVAPDAGQVRPWVCIGTGANAFPADWARALAEAFGRYFPGPVTIDEPFAGGYITRAHGREMPWVQIELSRGPFMSNADKADAVIAALSDWVAATSG